MIKLCDNFMIFSQKVLYLIISGINNLIRVNTVHLDQVHPHLSSPARSISMVFSGDFFTLRQPAGTSSVLPALSERPEVCSD
jgi:hypothetical protein